MLVLAGQSRSVGVEQGGGGLYVRLYRFRQTHGTFQKATRCRHLTRANEAIPFILCAPIV
jgi:hypothetical protein